MNSKFAFRYLVGSVTDVPFGLEGCFRSFAPRVFKRYVQNRKAIGIAGINPTSVFAKTTINLGCTHADRHTDKGNNRCGWCAILPGGKFNPKLGGHLVLEDAGVVLEFGPGDVALIPSAVITHYNLPLQEGEDRFSIVGYSAGMLFRHALLQTSAFLGKTKAQQEALLAATVGERLEAGWSAYSTLSELRRVREGD